MSGTVHRASDGAPLSGQRIQIWAHTTEGHERDPHSHGATLNQGMARKRHTTELIIGMLREAEVRLVQGETKGWK
jgi:hypothetical protein